MAAKEYKIAGQAAPSANTDTILYTIPTSKTFVGSSLLICNRDSTGTTAAFRVAVVPNGETLSNKHYIEYDKLLETRGSVKLALGFSLAAGDKVIIRSDTPDLSFTLFGVVIG